MGASSADHRKGTAGSANPASNQMCCSHAGCVESQMVQLLDVNFVPIFAA